MAERMRGLLAADIPEPREPLGKRLGFESDIEVVGAAASGAEALELAASLQPAVVLMDINMPGMDGIATAEQPSARPPPPPRGRPEMGELITSGAVKQILEALRATHDLVIVDTWPWFHETTLNLLDLSDEIVVLMTLEITNIKNVRLFLEVAEQLGYASDKVRLVLNRADAALGIRVSDVEHSIGRRIDETIVSDGRSVVYALNRGVPFVISNRDAQVSQDILRLARKLTAESDGFASRDAKPAQKKSLFARR